MTPGKKLKEIREKIKRLTQAEFATEYNLKLNTVRFIEQGRQDIPDELAFVLEDEFKIPFKWWKTGEGAMYIEQQECLAATGTYGRPHLRILNKEVGTIDDEKLKEIAKKLGRSITVEYIEDSKTDKTCEYRPDGQVVELPEEINLDKLIGHYLTEFEANQLATALKNNKTFLFIFIEKLNADPKAAKQMLLQMEN